MEYIILTPVWRVGKMGPAEYEDIDLTQESIDLRQKGARERFAQQLALRLVSYFGWTLLALMCFGVALLIIGAVEKENLSDIKTLVSIYLDILQAVGTFVASVFGSILGFILGHYFRKEGAG